MGKEEINLSLFTTNLPVFIENSQKSTRKLLQLTNEFSKFAGYKINTQKSVILSNTSNEKS